MNRRLKITMVVFLIPSLLGMLVFYLIPYLATYYYAFTDATTGTYVGINNYKEVMGSSSFRTAVSNTVVFMLICVPLNMLIPFFLAQLIYKSGKGGLLILAFMIPLVIPSGATVYFWKVIFGEYGAVNRILTSWGFESVHFFQSNWTLALVTIVFLFKNMGFNMVLFLAGFGYIPNDYYETAMVEGCSKWYTMRRITLVYLIPTAFMTLMMSIINSFKIFRETYLLFGSYPHSRIFMLQHYMNNLFSQAALQKLSVTATLISITVAIIVSVLFVGQKKISADL